MRIVLIGVSHWHTPFYSDPVHDTLRRVRDGRPPIADLADNAAAVALIEAAYAMSPLGG